MADRFVEVSLDERGVRCTARLLTDRAPVTCAAVREALPLGSDVYHAKYARNGICALVRPFAQKEPPLENPTVTPFRAICSISPSRYAPASASRLTACRTAAATAGRTA
jgi:hypothetical protein